MNNALNRYFWIISFAFLGVASTISLQADDKAMDSTTADSSELEDSTPANPGKSMEATLAEETTPTPPPPKPAVRNSSRRVDRADAFVAGPDWEFDGLVAGGQDDNVRSMFFINDLLYLNVGATHGLGTGDKVGIYKRGGKVRDPQTGKFIGYEVRRAALAHVTDRVEDETCAVRITNTYEAAEIGDLVRREQ